MRKKRTYLNHLFSNVNIILTLIIALFIMTNCSDENDKASLIINWQFSSGDCSSNGIELVRVEATPSSGAKLTGEASCVDNSIDLGKASIDSYSILAQGIDSSGKVRAENYGTTITVLEGGFLPEVDVTLHPKSSNVNVSWNGCPSGVILPYFITLYNPPAQVGETPTDKVNSVQETCSSGLATLTNVQPGDYVVELDSRAISPKVYATKSITVVAGEDLNVSFNLP